jgi:hypothetical protein
VTHGSRVPPIQRWAAVVIGLVTGYLLLERSHAEEVGNGSRVAVEFLRGELSPLTLVAGAVLLVALALPSGSRVAVPAEAAAPDHRR